MILQIHFTPRAMAEVIMGGDDIVPGHKNQKRDKQILGVSWALI